MSPHRGLGIGGATSASWVVRHETIAVGTNLHLLGGGGQQAWKDLAYWSPGVPPPTTENWLDATGAAPKKQEDQVAQM